MKQSIGLYYTENKWLSVALLALAVLRRHIQQHIPTRRRQPRHIAVGREALYDGLACLDASQRDERLAGLVDGARDGQSSLCLALGTNNGRLPLLLGLQRHQVSFPLKR